MGDTLIALRAPDAKVACSCEGGIYGACEVRGLDEMAKRGAIAVPLFTLFGPEGVRLRVADCTPRVLITSAEKAASAAGIPGVEVVVADVA